jgi:hypothetical protein
MLACGLVTVVGCTAGGNGTFDAGPDNNDSGTTGPLITAADIGTKCEYFSDGVNPSDTCPLGLSCLIYSYDGQYIPRPPGSGQNLTLNVWEDHFTVYRDDGVDEGYCTLMGTWQQPPLCPAGSQLKLLATNIAVCVRSCTQAADCGRAGYTCDTRFIDVQGGACVRGCQYDYPDCVRSGQLQRPVQNGGIALHLLAEDVGGSSMCDVSTGLCAAAPNGSQLPGQACNHTGECIDGTVCIQSEILQAMNPNVPANATGFCGQPCKPDQMMPLSGGCLQGSACQAGFTFGHGNPLDTNLQDANGFLLYNGATGDYLEAGGFCFPECQSNPTACDIEPGTVCGAANTATFGQAWNQVSMCLMDPLRQ